MIKTLIVGAVLGYYGKKLYDEGKLDPYLAEAKDKLGLSELKEKAARKGNASQPDLAL